MRDGNWGFAAFLCIFSIVVMTLVGYDQGKQAMRKEIVERGYGEFVVDKNLNVVFKWKESNE